ncbi:MAG: PDZ domain-containing protein [Clostridium sp.]|nr:PDZ domain-containing protein [Clostridium sp.]MCM1443975.1 PDZ domain-containing protein [Candidatus Amulumruptor caecigallinarius]
MITKFYEKIKNYIKENRKFLITLIIIFLISIIKLPFYIDAPGGLINVNDKITIENSNKINGSINLSYVSEYRATIPIYLYSLINKDYDIINIDDTKYDNETLEQAIFRSDIMLKESVNNATIVAYNYAKGQVTIKDTKVYITYVDIDSDTELKVGDEILKVENEKIQNKDDLYKILDRYSVGDKVTITVKRNNKEYNVISTLKELNNRAVIGIIVSEIYEVDTNPLLTFNYDASETGPSGGLMLTIAIYDYLTEEDIARGRNIVGTGTINLDGTVGSIGGVKYKLKGAVKNGADIFIVPTGENYDEVINLVRENNYNITIVEADTFENVINKLRSI